MNSKIMNSKNIPADLSYFRLALLAFLQESHPHLADDEKFIAARTEIALDAYEQSVRNGDNPVEAAYAANEALYNGLHFSRHDTLVSILWNEFSNEVPENRARETAIQLLPACESVFAQYPLSDDFAYEPAYELLYTELTGTIAMLIDNEQSVIFNS
ncbi:MAG: DUF1896 domain-containing protein [Tannerella sp.]|jgi:hypothetical protein|nr:DUF1896 domain-containing protein [Tannerella sp.]